MDRSNLLVHADGLSKSYQAGGGQIQAVDRIDLTIRAGEMVALVGPTGSGKTTLLSLLAGLDEPDYGTITLMGQRLTDLSPDGVTDLRSRAIGFIYQTYNLFPGFTVRDNIGLPLRLMLNPPFDAHQRAQEVMVELALTELADRYPPELSGGQQQLVAIARALSAKPPLILADEPTANLDTSAARQIMARLRVLTNDGDHGVLLTTHDLRMASQADRVLNLRDGRIVKETAIQPTRTATEVVTELA